MAADPEPTHREPAPAGHAREERQARLDPVPPHLFDLAALAAGLRAEPEYAEHGRAGTVLIKDAALRVVLQALRGGSGLAEHHAPGRITVQVLSGRIEFRRGGEVVPLSPGSLLTLPPGEPHAVEAREDSVFLLTLAARPGTG